MRILHVIPAVADRYGGPSAALRGMTAALAERGMDVTVVTTDADGAGRLPVPLETRVVQGGVGYLYFARWGGGEYKFSWPMTRWLWRNVAGFDAVHVHALFSYPTLPACRSAHRAGVPYVLRPLGTLGAWGLAHRPWKKAPYLALVERRNLRQAAAIHATSDAEARAVEALGYGDRTRVIPLGVEIAGDEEIAARMSSRRASLASPDSPLRVLFLSRMHPVKQLPLLLEGVSQADAASRRPIALTIAGDGDPAYVRAVTDAATRLHVRVPVRFLGHVEGEAKSAAFAEADVFALTSSHENFGIAAAEALARGVPVLLSRDVALAGSVQAAGAGVAVPTEAGAVAGALRTIAEDVASLAPMSAAAVSLARREYSWRHSADLLEALYREIAARRSERAAPGR